MAVLIQGLVVYTWETDMTGDTGGTGSSVVSRFPEFLGQALGTA
jgi:hypothetical protein